VAQIMDGKMLHNEDSTWSFSLGGGGGGQRKNRVKGSINQKRRPYSCASLLQSNQRTGEWARPWHGDRVDPRGLESGRSRIYAFSAKEFLPCSSLHSPKSKGPARLGGGQNLESCFSHQKRFGRLCNERGRSVQRYLPGGQDPTTLRKGPPAPQGTSYLAKETSCLDGCADARRGRLFYFKQGESCIS